MPSALINTNPAARSAEALYAMAWPFPNAAFAMTRTGVDIWVAAWGAWFDYLSQMSRMISPTALPETEARLLADVAEIGAEAAAQRLHAAGLSTPLLNDA